MEYPVFPVQPEARPALSAVPGGHLEGGIAPRPVAGQLLLLQLWASEMEPSHHRQISRHCRGTRSLVSCFHSCAHSPCWPPDPDCPLAKAASSPIIASQLSQRSSALVTNSFSERFIYLFERASCICWLQWMAQSWAFKATGSLGPSPPSSCQHKRAQTELETTT